uniref:F-box associated beta-propeller type 3 domain-containing protein n=1 Tax=Aegilops tauschii TaxID=37682 RepID=M8BEY2_AEGTA
MGMAATRLTDDLLVEILRACPAKSLARFNSAGEECFLESPVHFTSVEGSRRPLVRTSSAFLPSHRRVDLLDCCNGLLLCRWYEVSARADEFRYVVCNPATEKWVVLPDSGQAGEVGAARLGFDQASPHFHVFELVEQEFFSPDFPVYLIGVQVYSSESGRWVHNEKAWDEHIRLANRQSATVFLNGHLHFHTYDGESRQCLAAVDTEGETWTDFRAPGGLDGGHIQQSQGRLHYANFHQDEDARVVRLVVHVLEDYDSKEWILKHSVETSYLSGGTHVLDLNVDFHLIAVHPECNLIFFTAGWDTTFMCYNMDSRRVKVICNLEDGKPPYLPYVPLYTELPSLHT